MKLDDLKLKNKLSEIEECIIWAVKTDSTKEDAITELETLRARITALEAVAEAADNYIFHMQNDSREKLVDALEAYKALK